MMHHFATVASLCRHAGVQETRISYVDDTAGKSTRHPRLRCIMDEKPKKLGRRFAWATALVLALASIAAGAWWLRGRTIYTDGQSIQIAARDVKLREVLWTTPRPLEIDFGPPEQLYEPALSPDGTELYFVRGKPGRGAHTSTSPTAATTSGQARRTPRTSMPPPATTSAPASRPMATCSTSTPTAPVASAAMTSGPHRAKSPAGANPTTSAPPSTPSSTR